MRKKTAAIFLILALLMVLFFTFQNPEKSRILSESVRMWLGNIDERIKEINFGSYERINKSAPKVELFFPDPFHCPQFPDGENVQMVMARTQEFLRKLIQRNDEKTYLIATHGCALRAMLNFLYEDSADFWHGHVPYNCCVNIVEAKDGVAKLIADDKIYYPEEMLVDRYK